MYYHIIIEKNSANKKEKPLKLFLYDLSENEVKTNYCIPFLSGDNFFAKGYNLSKKDVSRFQVLETKDKAQDIANGETDKLPRGVIGFYKREEVIEDDRLAKDVTNIFLGDSTSLNQEKSKNNIKKNSVFIVHGRDHAKVTEIENFIRSIGLEPIVLFKETDTGDTIIEKIEKNVEKSLYGIVLYTSCDSGYPHDRPELVKPRARQNVVFEHGYLLGKLGRNHVCALVENDDIEKPGDISGVVYKKYDDNGLWKFEIGKSMNAVGMGVDLNKIK